MPRCYSCGSCYFETIAHETKDETLLECKGCDKIYQLPWRRAPWLVLALKVLRWARLTGYPFWVHTATQNVS